VETAFHAAVAHRRSSNVSHGVWLVCVFLVGMEVVVLATKKEKSSRPLAGVMQQGPFPFRAVSDGPRPHFRDQERAAVLSLLVLSNAPKRISHRCSLHFDTSYNDCTQSIRASW
jgi:hypothetical protein